MTSKAIYICFEGTEGVGKTTQSKLLNGKLIALGYKVLYTKEPGTPHLPVTMILRGLMLDAKYQEDFAAVKAAVRAIESDLLTDTAKRLLFMLLNLKSDSNTMPIKARELISQSIRSVHMEKLIYPAMDSYDFIIQDRGILSGVAYGFGCGNTLVELKGLACTITGKTIHEVYKLYDKIVLLTGNTSTHLSKAVQCKKEFEGGDVIESKGTEFMISVADTMAMIAAEFNTAVVAVDGKSIQDVEMEVWKSVERFVGDQSLRDNHHC